MILIGILITHIFKSRELNKMTGEHQLTIQRKGGKARDRCTWVSTQQIDDKSKHFIFVSAAAQINQLFRVERVAWDQFLK